MASGMLLEVEVISLHSIHVCVSAFLVWDANLARALREYPIFGVLVIVTILDLVRIRDYGSFGDKKELKGRS